MRIINWFFHEGGWFLVVIIALAILAFSIPFGDSHPLAKKKPPVYVKPLASMTCAEIVNAWQYCGIDIKYLTSVAQCRDTLKPGILRCYGVERN